MVHVGRGATSQSLGLQLRVIAHSGLQPVSGGRGGVGVLWVLRCDLGRRVACRGVAGGGGGVGVVIISTWSGSLMSALIRARRSSLLPVTLGQRVDELVRTHLGALKVSLHIYTIVGTNAGPPYRSYLRKS